MSKVLTHEEWKAEAVRRFGENPLYWRFVCPSCGYVASIEEWRDSGAPQSEAAFSCIGRHLNADGSKTFLHNGGPCNYAGGGLFRLNPVTVELDNRTLQVFEFAEPTDAR